MSITIGRPQRAAFIVLCLGALRCAAPSTPAAPPKIAFEAVAHDFGPTEQGTPLAYVFAFHNQGASDLVIDNVKSACDCTAVVRPGAIAPGAAGLIRAKCGTGHDFGSHAATMTVYSNDPAQPTTTLTLSADVVADVAADPPDIYVGRLRRGEQVETPIRLRVGRGRPPVGMRLPHPDGAVLRASMPGPTPGQTERTVTLSIQEIAPIGAFTEPVAIDTSSTTHPTVTVHVTGIVDGDLIASPREVRFGAVPRGESSTRHVIVRNQGDVPAHIIAATLTHPIGRAQIEKVREGQEYRIRVSLDPMLPTGRAQARLRIQTNRPEQPEIIIPVSATIREKK